MDLEEFIRILKQWADDVREDYKGPEKPKKSLRQWYREIRSVEGFEYYFLIFCIRLLAIAFVILLLIRVFK